MDGRLPERKLPWQDMDGREIIEIAERLFRRENGRPRDQAVLFIHAEGPERLWIGVVDRRRLAERLSDRSQAAAMILWSRHASREGFHIIVLDEGRMWMGTGNTRVELLN